jgi:DivIVA domain-containing protein
MALMPEDVLNKNFTATQFRRGYSEQEVDDFLDEVVVELRRLSSDNDELLVQLKACQESKGVPVAAGAVVGAVANEDHKAAQSAASAAAAQRQAAAERQAQERIASAKVGAEQAEQQAAARIAKAKAGAEQAEAQAAERVNAAKAAADKRARASFAVPATTKEDEAPSAADVANAAAAASTSAAGVLALAQKLHDQYVSEGQSTRKRLISEGQTYHDQVVREAEAKQEEYLSSAQAKHNELFSTGQAKYDELIAEAAARHEQMITEARERSTGMVAEAQQRKATVLQALSRERDVLQKKIDELRTFERDYRVRLKSYLEGQLHELDQTGADEMAGVESKS